ncbi:TPA: hypothetical protein ACMDQK_000988 [Vibrio cholerae]
MSVSEDFKQFLVNIRVDNSESISDRYGQITKALNKKFRNTESTTANTLQVGSYGRFTGIRGISDLDMLYIMPGCKWETYKDKQSQLLKDTKDAILARYPTTDVKVDSLVVVVKYQNFKVEVQPVFEQDDGSFKYPYTHNGGSWRITKPKDEINAMKEVNEAKNKNLRPLCKMARAWKNEHGVAMGGLLIDTLAHNFLKGTTDYDKTGPLYYDEMCRDFFEYLGNLPKQERWSALGSNQHVKVKKNFQRAAKKLLNSVLKPSMMATTTKDGGKFSGVVTLKVQRTLRQSPKIARLGAIPKSLLLTSTRWISGIIWPLTAMFPKMGTANIRSLRCYASPFL